MNFSYNKGEGNDRLDHTLNQKRGKNYEDVLETKRRTINVIPPRTTGVGRGFPTFRAGSSIIYRSSMNLVPLSAERRTTSMSTIDRCGGIAATDRNFCLFRDTRSLTDSGSY